MRRLTQQDRERLRNQLRDALLPSRADELRALGEAAFRAVIVNFYTANGLRRIAKLPQEWLEPVASVLVKPSGQPYWQRVHGAQMLLPRDPPSETALCATAQAAVDAWHAAVQADKLAREQLAYRLDRLLATSATLEHLLERLPEARDILKLPPAEAPEDIAADVRAQLAAAKAGAA